MSSISIAITLSSIAIVTSAITIAIVTSAKTSHVSSAEATDVTSTEAAHVTSSAKATATATSTCLCTGRKQRPGNQGGCQYHHRSSCSHECSFRGAEPSVIIELLAPGLIWSPGSEWLMGNFEGSNRSSRWYISTEKDDADQPRRIDKYRPMLIKKL
jgi:hypothetical protein